MASRLSPELKAVFRHRIRHLHLPDLAPHFAPRQLTGNLRGFLEDQIVQQRNEAAAQHGNNELAQPTTSDDNNTNDAVIAAMRAWLRKASPPITVVSFTRRPTYILPAQGMRTREPWEVEYLTNALKTPQLITFPEPPGWSPAPYHTPSETGRDDAHNPRTLKWEPGVLTLPCAEPMYFGPGQLSIWPMMDLLDHIQRGKSFKTKYEFERLLEDTTIQVLKREYGLDAFTIPGKTGVWVESLVPPAEISDKVDDDHFGINNHDRTAAKKYNTTRRIATVHADIVNDITRYGVSIHVSQPARTNPWAAIGQVNSTTSIMAELAIKGSSPSRGDADQKALEHRSDKKSAYLQTQFDESSPSMFKPQLAMPYSLVSLVPGCRHPVPMGLDHRDLSTAWTYEFARQLGLMGGLVDHVSMVDYSPEASSLPVKGPRIGLKAHPVMDEDNLVVPYEQVEVPSIQLKVAGDVTRVIIDATRRIEIRDERIPANARSGTMARSWPMYYKKLMAFLKETIGGRAWDTRLTQVLRQRKIESDIERRRQAIEKADVLRDDWRRYTSPRVYNESTTAAELIEATLASKIEDMTALARTLEASRSTVPMARLEVKMDEVKRLLQDLDHTFKASRAPSTAPEKKSERPAEVTIKRLDLSSPPSEEVAIAQATRPRQQTSPLGPHAALRQKRINKIHERIKEALAASANDAADTRPEQSDTALVQEKVSEVVKPADEASGAAAEKKKPAFVPFAPTSRQRLAAKKQALLEARISSLGPVGPFKPTAINKYLRPDAVPQVDVRSSPTVAARRQARDQARRARLGILRNLKPDAEKDRINLSKVLPPAKMDAFMAPSKLAKLGPPKPMPKPEHPRFTPTKAQRLREEAANGTTRSLTLNKLDGSKQGAELKWMEPDNEPDEKGEIKLGPQQPMPKREHPRFEPTKAQRAANGTTRPLALDKLEGLKQGAEFNWMEPGNEPDVKEELAAKEAQLLETQQAQGKEVSKPEEKSPPQTGHDLQDGGVRPEDEGRSVETQQPLHVEGLKSEFGDQSIENQEALNVEGLPSEKEAQFMKVQEALHVERLKPEDGAQSVAIQETLHDKGTKPAKTADGDEAVNTAAAPHDALRNMRNTQRQVVKWMKTWTVRR